MPIAEAREIVTGALKAEGFGVLTSIDVQATMKEKLDKPFDPYVILGACNPTLAHTAITTDADIGLLLPCNVVLHEQDGVTRVSIVDPAAMLAAAAGRPELEGVAHEASTRLQRVADTLAAAGMP
ncbi:MAG: DUF302 domain-containing protein [Thermomicrobiales bacterium]|nr:MAG: DUF302 domain-containing protein [Thermomicrobiales bacterium]